MPTNSEQKQLQINMLPPQLIDWSTNKARQEGLTDLKL